MDLAKNLAQWRDQPPEQWIAQANRYLPPLAVGVLVLLIAFEAADLTWRLLESPSGQDEVPPAVRLALGTDGPPTASGSYDTLEGWEPFGRAPDESGPVQVPAELVLDAPETTLNLTLVGLVSAQRLPEPGTVIYVHEQGMASLSSGRGEQKLYRNGQAIDNVPSTTLHSVFTDRILLDRGGGRLETLRYAETESTSLASSRVAARPQLTGIAQPESLSAAASIADAAGEAASLISEHMQVALHAENGQAIGFRLQPRGDGRVFAELGLEPGDVLTEVNGIQLNDMRNTAQVLDALSEAQQASVTIRRNGTDQALIFDVARIQRLAESLQ